MKKSKQKSRRLKRYIKKQIKKALKKELGFSLNLANSNYFSQSLKKIDLKNLSKHKTFNSVGL